MLLVIYVGVIDVVKHLFSSQGYKLDTASYWFEHTAIRQAKCHTVATQARSHLTKAYAHARGRHWCGIIHNHLGTK